MDHEDIVMTPAKRGNVTHIQIEKKLKAAIDESQVAHKAGGHNAGLVINKAANEAASVKWGPQDIQLEFKCYLVDQKAGKHVPESRTLKFWFAQETDYLEKVTGAYDFFKQLVKPDQFPRDYVGFIKRVMKQIREPRYTQIKKIDVELQQLEVTVDQPASPGGTFRDASGLKKVDTRPKEVIVQEQLLLTLESAYPNILPIEDLASMTDSDAATVQNCLAILKGKNLISEREEGKFVRKVLDETTEVKEIQNMQVMQRDGKRPTVAIITSKYNEKLAVDAMIEEKTTFVKYKTEGESNVYTIGYIGPHKVVSTKLPMIGRQMAAQISSGNTTTRLLGTFGDVEHVFLVGVAGGVPHYTDYYKHVRLGDVVVSTPNSKGNLYIFCDKITVDEQRGTMSQALKSWKPNDDIIQRVAMQLVEGQRTCDAPWTKYITSGQRLLEGQQVNFHRPPPNTDRLYMNIGGSDVIEVGHPPVPDEVKRWLVSGEPVLRHGAIGAGKPLIKDDSLRQDFTIRQECSAMDTEFDQVLESIVGNRKDSFGFIRGVCDYLDGTKSVEWQPYAALGAAAFMKCVIERLPA